MNFQLVLYLCCFLAVRSFKLMNTGNKIAASIIGGAILILPNHSQANDLLSEKRAKFSIGAGIHRSVALDKKAKFSIGAGIHKSDLLEKRAKFSIGAGIHQSDELDLSIEKRAKFSIGAGIH